jgi:transposase
MIGISERQMRRWKKRYEASGFDGLLDRRCGVPSKRRARQAQAEQVVSLYREQYFDLNVRHFHEKLVEEHQIGLSYTWVKQALQAASLVKRKSKRGGTPQASGTPPSAGDDVAPAAITSGFRMSVGTT